MKDRDIKKIIIIVIISFITMIIITNVILNIGKFDSIMYEAYYYVASTGSLAWFILTIYTPIEKLILNAKAKKNRKGIKIH